jgi:hypothetical protein
MREGRVLKQKNKNGLREHILLLTIGAIIGAVIGFIPSYILFQMQLSDKSKSEDFLRMNYILDLKDEAIKTLDFFNVVTNEMQKSKLNEYDITGYFTNEVSQFKERRKSIFEITDIKIKKLLDAYALTAYSYSYERKIEKNLVYKVDKKTIDKMVSGINALIVVLEYSEKCKYKLNFSLEQLNEWLQKNGKPIIQMAD